MTFDLSGLNPSQKKAIHTTEGPVMILAGAGSGKTRTLVSRISYLIEELQISPFKVLALTFSNKAAREMRERISLMVQDDIGALQMTTFHAFCARLLRSEANYLGLSRNFTIYDTSESKSIVKGILSRYGISPKELNPFDVLHYIDSLKNLGFYQGHPERELFEIDEKDPFHTYYCEYETELHRANALDFGGLIVGVLQLFSQHPEVLARYQDRFEYVLVDEYQDTNRAQFELIKLLCHKRRNVCVVGDEDQSIYSWRGADIRNILDMEEIFPELQLIKLEQNYRSSATIIEAASSVIARNSLRKGKSMWTENPEGELIEILECADDKREAEFIASEIKKILAEKNSLNDIAIFYRTNSQSRMIEDGLRNHRIPYRVIGGVKFYERKEIKDILAYARLIANPKDSLAFSRVVNTPARGVGATTQRRLEEKAVEENCSLLELLEKYFDERIDLNLIRLSSKVKSALMQFVSLIQELTLLEQEKTLPSIIFDKIIHETGYWDFLKASKDYESLARMDNLQELGSAIKQFEQNYKEPTMTLFLESITLDQSRDEAEDGEGLNRSGEVSLMTVHGAKGLEFPFVFLTGAEENVFPSFRAIDEGANGEEEERRLFYVAMTRAMKKLWITFAQGRMMFGQLKFNGPSRFLNEIDPKFVDWKKAKRSFFPVNNDPEGFDDFSQEANYGDDLPVYEVRESKSKDLWKYSKGCKVVHSLYGEGQVLESSKSGTDEVVMIKFLDGSKKKFSVKFAPLTKIEE
jgi:DNA helicase II / ATP-dependent DNA helicase PcrA